MSTSKNDRISVVIPAWNAGRFLVQAVESALNQSLAAAEIVIIDDGSTDNTAAIAAELVLRDHRVRVVTQANAGPGSARDRGIDETSGTLVALLDADDLWLPRKLELQRAALHASPSTGAVFTLAQNVFDGVAPRGPEGPMPAYLPSAMLTRRNIVLANGRFAAAGAISDWVPWFLRLREHTSIDIVSELLVHRRVHGANFTTQHRDKRAAYAKHVGDALRRRRNASTEGPTTGSV